MNSHGVVFLNQARLYIVLNRQLIKPQGIACLCVHQDRAALKLWSASCIELGKHTAGCTSIKLLLQSVSIGSFMARLCCRLQFTNNLSFRSETHSKTLLGSCCSKAVRNLTNALRLPVITRVTGGPELGGQAPREATYTRGFTSKVEKWLTSAIAFKHVPSNCAAQSKRMREEIIPVDAQTSQVQYYSLFPFTKKKGAWTISSFPQVYTFPRSDNAEVHTDD